MVAREAEADQARITHIGELVPRRIRVTVVHDNDAQVAVRLCEQTFDSATNIALPRIVWDASSDGWFEAWHSNLPGRNIFMLSPPVSHRRGLTVSQLAERVANSEALDK